MVKIMLASHGTFAEGIKSALELILGKQPNVSTICAYVNGENIIKPRIKDFIEHIQPDEEWVIVTDVFGGSVNNEFMNYLQDHRIHLVSGMNLPLLVELVTNPSESAEDKIQSALEIAKGEIKYCNLLLADSQTDEDF